MTKKTEKANGEAKLSLITNYKNWALISALISTVVGGGIQIFFLSVMDVFYLRFFSVTQMISDALVLLPILLIILFFYYCFRSLINILEKEGFFRALVILFGGIMGGFIILIMVGSIGLKDSYAAIIVFLIGLALIVIVMIFLSYQEAILKKIVVIGESSRLIQLGFIIFISIFAYLFFPSGFIKDIFVKPDHFINQDYICKKSTGNNCKITYFNDKYIFIERDNKKIEIVKFDRFFESEK